jgi:hypothetical protein
MSNAKCNISRFIYNSFKNTMTWLLAAHNNDELELQIKLTISLNKTDRHDCLSTDKGHLA